MDFNETNVLKIYHAYCAVNYHLPSFRKSYLNDLAIIYIFLKSFSKTWISVHAACKTDVWQASIYGPVFHKF